MRDTTEVEEHKGIVKKELQRGESQVEKQVKEARTKCRSIASLLTDAPNPNSKGVLMFKKRRQRAKKYTLTCFGKAPEDKGSETEGDTEEEGGSSILSGSELDEEGFSASYDPTWDSGYLDLLDRRSSACPSTTPTTPTTNHSPALDFSVNQTPPVGLPNSTIQSPTLAAIPGLDTLAYQDTKLENGIANQPVNSLPNYTPMMPPAMPMANGGTVAVSRASVVLSPPSQTPIPSQNIQPVNQSQINDVNATFNPSASNVLNRTARPFNSVPGTPSRSTVTSVMFRPPQPKPISAPAPPVSAVSMMTLSSPRQPDSKRAVSSTSLYIPARNTNGNSSDMSSIHSPPSSLSSATTISQPPTNPAAFPSPGPAISAQPYYPPPPQQITSPVSNYHSSPQLSQMASPTTQNFPYPNNVVSVSQPFSPEASLVPMQPPPPTTPVNAYFNTQIPMPPSDAPQVPTNDSLASREERIAVPAARTGILTEARRRSQKKPMFSALQSKDVNPNPDLLSIIQNMDDRVGKSPNTEVRGGGPVGEAGHESGPEEDWLRLGAEACNFMQAQRQPKPPPVAPKPKSPILPQMQEKPQAPQMPVLGGKGGQLFAKRQNRMDRYVVERSPSVAAMPYSPAQTREPSPTPSLPATWKYSSNIRAPPPINYNPLLSPSCPLKAQKKQEPPKSGTVKSKKTIGKSVDLMNHQPYQLSSSLFSYGGNANQEIPSSQPQGGTPGNVHKTAKVYEIKRFSTPPPMTTGPALKVIAPRSATTLGEPMWRSDIASPPPQANSMPYQVPFPQQQWEPGPLSPPPPPAPNAPLPQLPTFSSAHKMNPTQSHAQANRQFKSVPDLSPLSPPGSSSQSNSQFRVPRPRFSTSNLGLQPSVWRPGSTLY